MRYKNVYHVTKDMHLEWTRGITIVPLKAVKIFVCVVVIRLRFTLSIDRVFIRLAGIL